MKKVYLILSLLLLLSSCSSWLDVQPEDKLTEDQAFSSIDGFKNALNAIYIEMAHTTLYGMELTVGFVEVAAGRYPIQKENVEYLSVYEHKYTEASAKAKAGNIWDKMYTLIANLNILIKNCDARPEVINGTMYNIIKGEALALRAYLHFDLLRLFGPRYDAAAFANAKYNRQFVLAGYPTPIPLCGKFMELMMSDINESLRLLEQSDPIIKTPPTHSEDVYDYYRNRSLRLNYFGVKLLKARAALWMNDKPTALRLAKELIAVRESHFPFTTNLQVTNSNLPDRLFSSELIFSLENDQREKMYDKSINEDKVLLTSVLGSLDDVEYQGVLWGTNNSITSTLESAFGSDLRAKAMTTTRTVSANSKFYISHKYAPIENIEEIPNGKSKKIWNRLMPMMRISEAYYIAAECEPNEADGFVHLNLIRNTREISGSVSSNMDVQLLREYIKEFYMEGQLFYFYKRNNIDGKYDIITNGKGGLDLSMKNSYVLPVPDSETVI